MERTISSCLCVIYLPNSDFSMLLKASAVYFKYPPAFGHTFLCWKLNSVVTQPTPLVLPVCLPHVPLWANSLWIFFYRPFWNAAIVWGRQLWSLSVDTMQERPCPRSVMQKRAWLFNFWHCINVPTGTVHHYHTWYSAAQSTLVVSSLISEWRLKVGEDIPSTHHMP